MHQKLGPIDISCDCPPFHIVRACAQLGYQTPEDVRWLRMSTFLNGTSTGRDAAGFQPWKVLLGMNPSEDRACTCKQKLPLLERCTFVLSTGRETTYLLGQCTRCRTIFWEEG